MADLSRRLATNIRQRRGDLSQRAYAKRLGISQSTLARIENAAQNTTLATLTQLMKALKCDIGELFE